MKTKNPTIIFLHGWGESKRTWDSIISYFSTDIAVYTLDLLGFGENQNQYTIFSLDDYINQISNFLQVNNIEKTMLVGHSFGGRLAALFAIQHPQKVEKLVLYSSSIPFPDQHTMYFSLIRNFINKKLLILFSLATRGLRNKIISLNDYTQLRATYTNSRSTGHFYKKLYLIKQPVLLMAGRFDFLATLSHQKNLLKQFTNAQLVIFNRSTHLAHFEEKKRFVSILKTFIQE